MEFNNQKQDEIHKKQLPKSQNKIDIYLKQDPLPNNNNNITGCGILFYSIPPGKNQEPYFLLGRDKHYKPTEKIYSNPCFELPLDNSNQLKRKGIWSEFGGSIATNETAFSACQREVDEETLGIFQIIQSNQKPSIVKNKNNHNSNRNCGINLCEQLEKKNYLMKIVLKTDDSTRDFKNHHVKEEEEEENLNLKNDTLSDNEKKYVMFLKEIPWQPENCDFFTFLQEKLSTVELCGQIYENFINKSNTKFGGVSCPLPRKSFAVLSNGYSIRFLNVESVEVGNFVEFGVYIGKDTGTFERTGYRVWSNSFSDSASFIEYSRAMYCHFYAQKNFNELPNKIKLHHSIYLDTNGLHRVKEQYLEKSEIKYWSMSRMNHVLGNCGFSKNDTFRYRTLACMALVMNELGRFGSHDDTLNSNSFGVNNEAPTRTVKQYNQKKILTGKSGATPILKEFTINLSK